MNKLRAIGDCFLFVTVSSTIAAAIFITIFFPDESAALLWQILIVSFLCGLSMLILPENSKTRWWHVLLHYLTINGIVLGCGAFWWFDIKNPLMFAGMVILVAIVYGVVYFFMWRRDAREAERMNLLLKEYQRKKEADKTFSLQEGETHT